MDRTEAYKILISEIESTSVRCDIKSIALDGSSIEKEITTNAGRHYTVSVKVILRNNEYHISGNIHDNNSFKYELLEESIVINGNELVSNT